MDQELLKISREDKEVRLLMTVPGIRPIMAITYQAEIFGPSRFKNSRTVGTEIGMTPTQYSLGEMHKQGRISRCGSSELRFLLTEAALVVLTKSKKWSPLKPWGLKLMRKKGIKKASVAVGRKLAVLMHRMLIDGKEFIYEEAYQNIKAA